MISFPPAALKSERSAFVAFRNLPVGRAALISLSVRVNSSVPPRER
jgi:hypothetical protein